MLNIKPVIRHLSIVRDSQYKQMAVTDGKAEWWLYTYDEDETRSLMSGIAGMIEARGCAVIIDDTILDKHEDAS